MTGWIKKRVASVSQWQKLDANYEVGEFTEKLFGWLRESRFVVIRERVRESRPSVGRKLFEIQDYTWWSHFGAQGTSGCIAYVHSMGWIATSQPLI